VKHALVFVLFVSAGLSRSEAAPYFDDTVQDQWFTGSLIAPSPALSKAGVLATEPYATFTSNTGAYNSRGGHYSVPNGLSQIQSETLLKYSVTDQLSVNALPSFNDAWNGLFHSSGTDLGMGDLPIEFQYRFNDGNRQTGSPSVTVGLGMIFPTGDYDNLSNPLNGFGSGAYTLKEELLFQSLFDAWGNHPMRVRLYGDLFEPVGNVPVRNTSVYGTSYGFRGQANKGLSADWGIGVEYGLNQRWVLALDLVQNYAAGFRLNGTNIVGNGANANSGSSTSIALAPAVEYNFSSHLGLIVGVEFSAAGRNTASYIAPQIALSMTF
jgi:hypothetical protein